MRRNLAQLKLRSVRAVFGCLGTVWSRTPEFSPLNTWITCQLCRRRMWSPRLRDSEAWLSRQAALAGPGSARALSSGQT